MSEIPLELIADILSRLLVKPLLQFRCVSKSWCALIDSPHFIKSHLNQSIKTNTNRMLILSDFDLFSVDLDSPNDDELELDHPLKNQEDTIVIGSCDGLLCLRKSPTDIALWNPSTKKHHKLPVTPIEFSRDRWSCDDTRYGFGYDSVSDDYKVVRITVYSSEDDVGSFDLFDSEVKVYSLKLNTWRRIQAFPYYLLYSWRNATFANGALHWAVWETDQVSIAAFDLGVEEYRLVPRPDYSNKMFEMDVGVLEGWLCVICHSSSICDLWVMKEYGVKESWTRLFSVSPLEINISPFSIARPLAFSRSGVEVILLQDAQKFVWYDLKMKTITKEIKVDWEKIEGVFIYFGSLVPLP
ncbi:F-box protein CPR1-like [Cornus florida]|uniref:F-box protein CPR1-like n=1 Tax=Cornus florida TaxID=4283 RepID=UPI0028A18262|nr:F-box protein CPR1-like [Cornus florida]